MDTNKPVVIVTGVSGRIGSAVSEIFSARYQVVGLDIIEPKKHNIDFIFTDLSAKESVDAALQKVRQKYGNKIASVIHLAAYYNFKGGAWEKYEKITIGGTRNLLSAILSFQVDQFLFSSTMLVYAPCEVGEKIHEDSPLEPKWEYPLSKVKTEELIHELHGPISTVILRIAGVYDSNCHSIPISQQIIRMWDKKLESHFFPGNLTHGSSFLHMEDLVHAIHIIVEKRKELRSEEIFVLGEEEVMSYKQLQSEMGRLLFGKPWKTFRIPKFVAKIGAFFEDKFLKESFIKPWMIDLADDHYDLDISKAEKELGWQPAHTLKNCLPRMVEQLKRDPEKWRKEQGLI